MKVYKGLRQSGRTLMISRDLPQGLQSRQSLIIPVLSEKPQGTLVQEPSKNEKNSRWDDLHSHGNPPGRRRCLVHVLIDAIVDPEAHKGARLVRDFEETREDTADGGNGELSDVAGDGRGDGAAGQTGENAASIDVGELVGGSGHNDGANKEDNVGDLESPFSADLFGDCFMIHPR